jgi:hypothetical protein
MKKAMIRIMLFILLKSKGRQVDEDMVVEEGEQVEAEEEDVTGFHCHHLTTITTSHMIKKDTARTVKFAS